MPRRSGNFDDRFIDKEIAARDLSNPIEREKIVKPKDIKLKLKCARSEFEAFVRSKAIGRTIQDKDPAPFQMPREALVIRIGLSEIHPPVTDEQLGQVLKSVPGVSYQKGVYYFDSDKIIEFFNKGK